ncbi:primase-helicase family protein [Halarcobacter sp.]|uniref:primase-helicase family protein n=1 Tax=Halarcobacter sp. TaxID=2321133 RepID=UPI003B0054CE
MKKFDSKVIEKQIFVDPSESIEEITFQEEINKSTDIFERNNKLEIVNTHIICDGSGFQNFLEQDDISEAPLTFSNYKFNNFRVSDNEYLIKLENAGGALIMFDDGELMLRSSPDSEFKKITSDKASIVIGQLICENVVVGRGSKDRPPEIKYNDLMLVSEIVFDVNNMYEFFKDGNTYKLNKFKPNKYLMLDKNLLYKKPVNILKLIAHLVDYSKERFHYIINWLAYMFKYLNKSQIAIVLRGVQGSGKGIFFNQVISILFGKEFCFTVGNKTLKSQFLGSVFENKLFININEMSHDIKSNKENKNSLKELVTDSEFAGEKKYENISKPIKLTAQILITSNEAYILEIEPEDRRYTVLSTSGNISSKECDFFGFGDFKIFKKQLESELLDFALYLKNYPIDTNLANKALNTPEKKALVKGTNDRFKLFINALLTKDAEYLEPLKMTEHTTYANIVSGFKKGRIYQRDILPTYLALNPNDFNISTQALLDKLEIYEPTKFSRELRKKSGDWYFNL